MPLATYLATLQDDVAFWDGGEAQTVPYILGITHAPGFPTFVLTAWLFSHAFTVGSVAWRIALISALCVAATATIAWKLVRDETGSARMGLFAALLFASSAIVWARDAG